MSTRKYAVLIYPKFSLQEITCLTSCLTVWFEEKIDIIASEKRLYTSEDGFSVMPDKTVEEANVSDYECLILPGTIYPLVPLFDEKLRTCSHRIGARLFGKFCRWTALNFLDGRQPACENSPCHRQNCARKSPHLSYENKFL